MRKKFLVLATVATMALAGAAAPAFASGTVTTVTCATPLKAYTFTIDAPLPTAGTFTRVVGGITFTVTFNGDGTATVRVGPFTGTCFVSTTSAAD